MSWGDICVGYLHWKLKEIYFLNPMIRSPTEINTKNPWIRIFNFQSNKTIRTLNLESNSITADMVINIIKSTANTKVSEKKFWGFHCKLIMEDLRRFSTAHYLVAVSSVVGMTQMHGENQLKKQTKTKNLHAFTSSPHKLTQKH